MAGVKGQKGHTAWNKGLKGFLAGKKHYNFGKKRPGVGGNKKGHRNTNGFKKGHIPWNKGMIGLLSEENSPHWKGGDVGYGALHHWIVRYWGNPEKCEECGCKNKLNRNNASYVQWANKTGKYLRKRRDWLQLCPSCHIKYDKINHDPHQLLQN